MHTFISIYKKLVPCHVRTDHPNKALKQRKAIRLKQTSRQTCITHKVMFSSIPRETYFKYFFFFSNKCVLSCIQINLVGLSSFLLHRSHACLSCSQGAMRNSRIRTVWFSQRRLHTVMGIATFTMNTCGSIFQSASCEAAAVTLQIQLRFLLKAHTHCLCMFF